MRIQKWFKERKEEDDYIHSYVHHTGYEKRARCPKARPEDGRTQTAPTGQTETCRGTQ